MSEEDLERKNKKKALLYTSIIQVVLFVVLFFIVAWRAPDPPLPDYGIELNFGLDEEGSGDVQPETAVGNEGKTQEQPAEDKPVVKDEPEEVKEEIQEEAKPVEPKPAEEQIVSKVESPVVVKEKKEEVKPVEKPAEKPEEKKVAEKPKIEEKKVEEKPKVNPDAVYKPSTQSGNADSKATESKEGKAGNHGDDPGKTGDKGNPEGTLDAKALYGKPGGGSGGVSMSGFNGFKWPKVTKPPMPEGSYGAYEFAVKVDDQGNVISVKSEKRGLSLEAERILKDMIQKLTFEPEGSNLPPTSEGRITIRIVSE